MSFDVILYPLMVPVAWIMVQIHTGLSMLGLDEDSGLTWALSIVGLVIVMRILLIPLFVRQIRAARGMQMLSPDLQALQLKYKGKQDPASREAMSREMMELYRKHGTNPFASCLPILAQSPIFFALFRVLYNMPNLRDGTFRYDSIGPLTRDLARDFTDATFLNVRLSDWFFMPNASSSTRFVTVVLIVLMSATTFFTQRQLTQKNMPASALQGPMAQQQKMLLYMLPLVFAVSGVNFPIGVLIYWTTTNVWSMGQQFYVIRRNPTPGSEAERRLKERRRRRAAAKGIVLAEEPPEPEKPRGQRQQPVRKGRARPRLDADGKPIPPSSRKSGEADTRKSGETGQTTPRKSGETGQTTSRRSGDTGQTTPRKSGETGQTTSRKSGETGQTTSRRSGETGQSTPRKSGETGQTTPRKSGKATTRKSGDADPAGSRASDEGERGLDELGRKPRPRPASEAAATPDASDRPARPAGRPARSENEARRRRNQERRAAEARQDEAPTEGDDDESGAPA